MAELICVRALELKQPIGSFFSTVIKSSDLVKIASADLRRIGRELDQYVGIQRKLNETRVREIGEFVNSVDATFPTSVVLSIGSHCVEWDEGRGVLNIFAGEDPETGEIVSMEDIARILDGQHRVEGLKHFSGEVFDVPVSVFVDADIADQAYIFATVNLAQTKVNKSLVYDLFEYAKARSPQKSAHDIVVALDNVELSPLYQMIKRLGTATPGRDGETLAQATVVNSLIPFISSKPESDRYALAKGRRLVFSEEDYPKTPFRGLWIEGRDSEIARIMVEYFNAVRKKWPLAWGSRQAGVILPRTNGFRALMRFLKDIYLRECRQYEKENPVLLESVFKKYFDRVGFVDTDFTTAKFRPGTSGETDLYKALKEQARV